MKKLRSHIIIALGAIAMSATACFGEPRVLTFGDSNTWGWIPDAKGFPSQRYPDNVRWSGVLEAVLRNSDASATVVVDGLTSRTVNTAYSEAQNGIDGQAFNGLATVDAAMASALPLDLVVIMLGTNDARSDLESKPDAVADDISKMVQRVRSINGGVGTTYPAPKVLVVAPPAIGDTSKTPISGIMKGSGEKSKQITQAIVAKGKADGFDVFDASTVVKVESVDGIHFEPQDHKALGEAVAIEAKRLLSK
jgi:lysophospholipase L1-like esterase